MISFLLACTLLSLITSVLSAGHNNSREFLLRTQLKPGQPRKTRFDGLYLETYHTGAGFNDAVFSWQKNANSGSHFYLNGTELDAEFDDEYIWSMQPAPNANFYASWEPVRINAIGEGAAGFSISRTGLEWESDPSQGQTVFLGWFGESLKMRPHPYALKRK